MTDKTDLKREISTCRAPRGRFELVDVPELRYLMIDGHGDPNTGTAFADATAALYPLAYELKFAGKKVLGRDYVVMPPVDLSDRGDRGHLRGRRRRSSVPSSGGRSNRSEDYLSLCSAQGSIAGMLPVCGEGSGCGGKLNGGGVGVTCGL
jgi:hypothetical protein